MKTKKTKKMSTGKKIFIGLLSILVVGITFLVIGITQAHNKYYSCNEYTYSITKYSDGMKAVNTENMLEGYKYFRIYLDGKNDDTEGTFTLKYKLKSDKSIHEEKGTYVRSNDGKEITLTYNEVSYQEVLINNNNKVTYKVDGKKLTRTQSGVMFDGTPCTVTQEFKK